MAIPGGLTVDQIDALVELTLRNYRRNDWVDLTTELQQYLAMGTMLANKRVGIEGGEKLSWTINLKSAGNARNTGLYSQDAINQDMDVAKPEVGWAFQDTHFAYDRREPDIQRGGVALIQRINILRHDALTDLAKLQEDNFWGKPANATDQGELLKPKGLLYWVVPNASQGFNGQNPAGFSDVAGLDSTAARFERWRNWTDTYKAKSFEDMVAKMKLAAYKTHFKHPIPFPEIGAGPPSRMVVTTYAVVAAMELLVRSQNDNLGNDLAAKEGSVMFQGNRVIPVPYLDENAGALTDWKLNPIIMLNLKHFGAFFLRGNLMVRSDVRVSDQHNVRAIFYDTTMQYKCTNRRTQAYLYEA